MKELQACSYLVSLNSDTLLNCAHNYSTIIYISLFYQINFYIHQIRQLDTYVGCYVFTGHD